MIRRSLRVAAAIAAIALLGVAGSQCISRGFIYANIGSIYTWSSSPQSGWNGSTQIASEGDFCTYVQNNGCAGEVGNRSLSYAQSLAWAENGTTLQPLSNPWFVNGATSWTVTSGTAAFSPTTDSLGTPPS